MVALVLFGGSGRDRGAAITGCCTPAAGRAVDREERELQDKEELERKQEEQEEEEEGEKESWQGGVQDRWFSPKYQQIRAMALGA